MLFENKMLPLQNFFEKVVQKSNISVSYLSIKQNSYENIMALISRIREKSGLLITLITLALAGFILMDMMSNRGSGGLFSGGASTVGKVNGKALDWNELNQIEKTKYGNASGEVFPRHAETWNYMVDNEIVNKEATALGLGVGKEELIDLQFGNNPSPVIQRNFGNQQTGQMDRERLAQIKQALEAGQQLQPDFINYWASQEKEIIKERVQTKIANMVSKAIYTPTWQAEQANADMNQKVDFLYVKIPFDQVSDADAKLTDADYSAYIEENKGMLNQKQEARKLTYVAFDVFPTAADSAKNRQVIEKLIAEFKEAKNDSLFTITNDGVYSDAYAKKDALPKEIQEAAFSAPKGTVIGPFVEGGAYMGAKILDVKIVADSMKARHILIQAKTPEQSAAAKKTIDSLKLVLESGKERFDSLATRFSQDGGSAAKGGDLGFFGEGRMVKEFNDICFYKGSEGRYYSVQTQFGWHLIEITGKKAGKGTAMAKLAYVREAIVPTEETQNAIADQARKLMETSRTLDALKKNADAAKVKIETSTNILENDFNLGGLGGSQTSRDIVRWAYNPKTRIGEVSPELYVYQEPNLYYNNKFAVVGLQAILQPGTPTVASAKDDVGAQVKSRKKGEILKAKITTKDLASVATTFNTQIDTAKGVSFAAPFVSGLGNEPKVIARVFATQLNGTTDAIPGNNGVYMAQLINKPALEGAVNISMLRQQLSSPIKNQVKGRLLQALRDKADVKDFRSKFY